MAPTRVQPKTPLSPGPGSFCALVTLAEPATAATLLVTAQTGSRAAAGERGQKEKIVVVDVDIILAEYVTENEEIMYILC